MMSDLFFYGDQDKEMEMKQRMNKADIFQT